MKANLTISDMMTSQKSKSHSAASSDILLDAVHPKHGKTYPNQKYMHLIVSTILEPFT